jgi:hypothetical protein
MIAKLKATRFGKGLYRASKQNFWGAPIRLVARALQTETLHPSHLYPANLRHNAAQVRMLKQFEQGTRE